MMNDEVGKVYGCLIDLVRIGRQLLLLVVNRAWRVSGIGKKRSFVGRPR